MIVGRRFPSRREIRAIEIGCDELMALLDWQFRNRPRALRWLRRLYRFFCWLLLSVLESSRERTVSA
jgi:hypothetical protein